MATVGTDGGTYDYASVTAALSASETTINPSGTFASAETANYTVSTGPCTIEALGSAKAPEDSTRTTSTHWRSRVTSGNVFATTVDLSLIALDIVSQSTGTSDEIVRCSTDNSTISFNRCILAFNTRNSQQDVFYGNDIRDATVNMVQCVGWNIQRAVVDSYHASVNGNVTANINGCRFYNVGGVNADEVRTGIVSSRASSGTDEITANLLNCSFHFHSDFNDVPVNGGNGRSSFGTSTFVKCLKTTAGNTSSDWCDTTGTSSISETQAAMNWTDDNTKSSDGDWEIVTDITGTQPFDLRLQDNTYNEAQDYSSTSSGAGLTEPSTDWAGTSRPQNTDYDVGPFEYVSGSPPSNEGAAIYYYLQQMGAYS